MGGWVGGRDGRTEGRTDLGLLLLNAQLEARGEAVNVDRGVDDGEVEARELLELEEGVAQRASDIDIVWINGYGWPVYRGGPMFWAQNDVGRERIVEVLEKMGEDVSPVLKDGWK